jgi:hypothetical protein
MRVEAPDEVKMGGEGSKEARSNVDTMTVRFLMK